MNNTKRKWTNWTGMTVVGSIAFYLVSFSALAADRPKVPSIDWEPCGSEFPAAECAMIDVPLDYDRPHGQQIELALARIPSSNPEEKIGSLFINPGGPGGSGVDVVLYGGGEEYALATDGRFDVVGFDPRGVGASTPIRCFDSQEESNAFFDELPVFPYKEEQK